MTAMGWLQIVAGAAGRRRCSSKPLGLYMARVFEGKPVVDRPGARPGGAVSSTASAGIDPKQEMGWKKYAVSLLAFNLVGFLLLYLLQRIQGALPGGPAGLGAVRPDLAFNTAVSFVTNTNWQAYGGETHHEVRHPDGRADACRTSSRRRPAWPWRSPSSAASRARSTDTIGNFWVDMTRSVLYILLPLSIVLAIVLVSQGVVQTFHDTQQATLLQATTDANGAAVTTQQIAVGPGGLADGHQAARHQRRRLLQRQLGAPVREPHAVLQLRGAARHPAHPGRRSPTPSARWWATPGRAGRCSR